MRKRDFDMEKIQAEKTALAVYQTGRDDKAMLPHVIARVPLFTATRAPRARAETGVTIERKTVWGDEVKIQTLRRLYCDLDLTTFLSVIALVQKHGISHYNLGDWDLFLSSFSVPELYHLTNIPRQMSEHLYESLRTLGATNLTIKFGDKSPVAQGKVWESKAFWEFQIKSRPGRAGNLLTLNVNPLLVPNERSLYADMEKLAKIRRPLSKAVFWVLLCREHYRGTLDDWKALLGVRDSKQIRWLEGAFIPALEDLEKIGYSWSMEEDKIRVSRRGNIVPNGPKNLHLNVKEPAP